MEHNHFICFCFVVIVLQILIPFWVNADYDDDSWMEPDAWSQEHLTLSMLNKQCCKCAEESPVTISRGQLEHQQTSKFTEDGVALMYLRRWLSLLFDRKKLMHDDQLQTYERSLTFFISSSQLEKIEKLKDPRDLDEVITEIFVKAEKNKPHMGCDGHYHATGIKALVVDIFIDLFELTKISEIRFLSMAAFVVICGHYLHKQYHISYLRLSAGGLFLFGYLHTYLECNRELEVNEMMDVLQRKKENQSRFMGFLSGIFSSSNSNDEEEYAKLIKSAKVNLGFCRPDHVAIMYYNDIFLKFLQVLIEQCTRTLKVLQGNLPWPFNYFASIMLICIIGYMLKLTFKYILNPASWSSYFNRRATLTQADEIIHNADRISGDNLKTLLSALHISTERIKQTIPAVSGVEEVEVEREAIESAPVNDTSTSSVSNSVSLSKVKTKNNNDPPREVITKCNDVKMEDLPDAT